MVDDALERRRASNRASAARARAAKNYSGFWPIQELIIELELLKDTDTPESIAHRLGYQRVDSLHRRLCNHGYLELARLFDAQQHRHTSAA